jgi:hypothetical protein
VIHLLELLAGVALVAWFVHERARVQRARQFNPEVLDRWEEDRSAALGRGPLRSSEAPAE